MHKRQKQPRATATVARVVQRNIEAILSDRRRAEQKKSVGDRLADALTAASGSMWFVYLHALWFGGWILWNLGVLGLALFDPFPFGLLTMIVSLEAILLSTFVLISQNRQATLGDRRADLDVQINLLAEHEITRLLCLVSAIARQLKVDLPSHLAMQESETRELEKEVHPGALLKEIERRNGDSAAKPA